MSTAAGRQAEELPLMPVKATIQWVIMLSYAGHQLSHSYRALQSYLWDPASPPDMHPAPSGALQPSRPSTERPGWPACSPAIDPKL